MSGLRIIHVLEKTVVFLKKKMVLMIFGMIDVFLFKSNSLIMSYLICVCVCVCFHTLILSTFLRTKIMCLS
jgi:hypothetical protein